MDILLPYLKKLLNILKLNLRYLYPSIKVTKPQINQKLNFNLSILCLAGCEAVLMDVCIVGVEQRDK